MTTDQPQPGDLRKSLGVWLALLALMVCAAVMIRIDASRDSVLPLQVKAVPPVVSPATGGLTPPRSEESLKGDPVAVSPTRTKSAESVTSDSTSSPLIRVNIMPSGTKTLQMEIRGPYSVRLFGTSRELGTGNGLATSKVQSTPNGLKVGDKTFNATQLEIVPQRDSSVRVDDHLYRGTMRLFRRKDGLVSAVNVLPLEDYLASVVDSEMPATFPEAARQAQAIVGRTYALYQISHADPAAVYDLFSSQRSQKYLGVEYTEAGRRLAGESAASRLAVAATRGVVCVYRGQLFCTYYSAVCGGQTTSGSEIFSDAAPVLKSVPCEWCRDSEYYRWTAEMDRGEFLKGTQSLGSLSGLTSIRQTAGPGGGTISRFRVTDNKQKSVDVSSIELRERFPTALRSPHFTLTLQKDRVRADGRGHGHGVGFCQWGARGQALNGRTVDEIVRHYYPGAETMVIENGGK